MGLKEFDDVSYTKRDGKYTVVTDEEEEWWPSEEHGMKLMVPLFLSIIVLAAFMTAVIFYCNKKQEERTGTVANGDNDKKQERLQENLHKKLTPKPWVPPSESESCERTVDLAESESSDGEFANNNATTTSSLECTLCSKEFERGEPVYESNNPQCHHQFHPNCIDTWLKFQNSCPTCNQPFVLQTV